MKYAITLLGALCLQGTAGAQAYTETFTASDEGAYEIIGDNWNSLETTGGNPGAYKRLMNSAGTGDSAGILTTSWPSSFSGDWRAAGIGIVGFDMDISAGVYNQGSGIFTITIANDSGTVDTADDNMVTMESVTLFPPTTSGWMSYDWDIPTGATQLPGGWSSSGPSGVPDTIWNIVMQDVSYMDFRMDMNPSPGAPFNILWDLGVDNIRVGQGSVGTSYCQSSPNSSGSASVISASGSSSLAQNNLVLSAGPMANEPGIFFFGTAQLSAPFGNGTRCVGGSVFRLSPNFATGNVLTRAVDLSAAPASVITVGSIWNFQAWFRDPAGGGVGFDLSDGLAIGFLP